MWSYHWSQWSWMWSWVWLGNLIVHPVYEAGGYYPKHPYDSKSDADDQDMQKENCCLYSTHCTEFHAKRPLKTCDGFIPSRISKLTRKTDMKISLFHYVLLHYLRM